VRAITAAGGAVWAVAGGRRGHVWRVTEHGTRSLAFAGPRSYFDADDIAFGPDGALWFTQSGAGGRTPDGIARMTTDGSYRSWPLPHRHANPRRIAVGPDGALWFTELDGHAIGRITTGGTITEFPVGGLLPSGIAPADGALWFTADACVGRITTTGKVTTWRVRHARHLTSIAA